MRAPFRLAKTPAENVNAGHSPIGPSVEEIFAHAEAEGESLIDAMKELTPPDRNAGDATPKESGQNHGEDHPQRPVWPQASELPVAQAVTHSPMRLKK